MKKTIYKRKPARATLWLAMGTCALVLGSVTPTIRADEKTVSLESLLDEMVDRHALARWPDPEYACEQVSSYPFGQNTQPTNKLFDF